MVPNRPFLSSVNVMACINTHKWTEKLFLFQLSGLKWFVTPSPLNDSVATKWTKCKPAVTWPICPRSTSYIFGIMAAAFLASRYFDRFWQHVHQSSHYIFSFLHCICLLGQTMCCFGCYELLYIKSCLKLKKNILISTFSWLKFIIFMYFW